MRIRFFFTGACVCGALLTLLCGACRARELPRHDLSLQLNPEGNTMTVRDRVSLPLPKSGFAEFRLNPKMEIGEVLVQNEPVPWNFSRGTLRIGPLPAGRTPPVTLDIRYRGVFADPAPAAPLNTEDPTYGVSATITRRGTFLSGGAYWHPAQPGRAARFHLSVRSPKGTWAVTAGRLVERGESPEGSLSIWKTQAPLSTLTLAAGPYEVDEDRSGPVPVYTFFSPKNSGLASRYLATSRDDLKLYADLFGPYPFPKFAVVENFFPTGYGFPSWTLLGSRVVPLPFIVTTSLGHEIAHNWWGTGVRVDYRRGNWSEGLATYVADYLFKERRSAAEAREYRLKLLRDYATLVPPGQEYPLSRFTSRRSKIDQAIGYGKSAMVFHMARRRVGDEAFWAGLREVATKRMFHETGWQDFAEALEGKAPETDMKAFFRQWVDRSGAPELKLSAVRARETAHGWRVSGKIIQDSPVYDLNLPLYLKTRNGSTTQVLKMREAQSPFTFTTDSPPVSLEVDPKAHVFRRLAPGELPATVNALRSGRDLAVLVSADLPEGYRRAARDLLTGLGRKARWIEERQADPAELGRFDLIYLGWPETRSLQPALPEGLEAGRSGFTIAGERFPAAEDALFAAFDHPFADAGAAALFLPLSPRAGVAAARKIPHYGKFSYLVFSSGNNRAKGTWTPPSSPLVHRFTETLP